jgi:hypothetical protein
VISSFRNAFRASERIAAIWATVPPVVANRCASSTDAIAISISCSGDTNRTLHGWSDHRINYVPREARARAAAPNRLRQCAAGRRLEGA